MSLNSFMASHTHITYTLLVKILVANDSIAGTADCLACELRQYQQADLVIGLHGAGLTNLIFMRPRAVVLEIVGQYDGRMVSEH
jgi:hypothetical protein